jgi:hypothetical protein
MEPIKVQTHVGKDKILKLEMPVDNPDTDYEVTIQALPKEMSREEWLAFIDATYGSLADDPIERGPQGDYEVRDEIE